MLRLIAARQARSSVRHELVGEQSEEKTEDHTDRRDHDDPSAAPFAPVVRDAPERHAGGAEQEREHEDRHGREGRSEQHAPLSGLQAHL